MLITSKHLQGACQDQIDLFNKTFPVGAEFNKTNWDLALRVGLQVRWTEGLLDESNCKIYEKATVPALDIYDEETAPARKIYKEAETSALKIYNEAIAPTRKIHDEVTAPAWKIYNEAITPAWKIYEEATAPARKILNEVIASALFNTLEKQFKGTK